METPPTDTVTPIGVHDRSGSAGASPDTEDMAQTRREVLQGRPFMGTVSRKQGRKTVFVDVIEEPITLKELADEEDVYGTILISMPTVEDPIQISLGDKSQGGRSDATVSEQTALARALEKVQTSEKVEDRIASITERYEEKIEILEERLEHHKERADDYREKLHEAEERFREERRHLEDRHREEKNELLDQIEELKKERIEIRESTQQSPMDVLLSELAKSAPQLTQAIQAGLAQGVRANPQGLPSGQASAGQGNTTDTTDTQETDMSGTDAVEVSRDEVREGIIQGMLGVCVQYMQGEIETQEALADQMQTARQKMEEKYGVTLGKAGWIDATRRLAQVSLQQDWPEEEVANMVEPIAREFAPDGSMAATILKSSPPETAAGQLLSLVQGEVSQDVQTLIVDILSILKNRL